MLGCGYATQPCGGDKASSSSSEIGISNLYRICWVESSKLLTSVAFKSTSNMVQSDIIVQFQACLALAKLPRWKRWSGPLRRTRVREVCPTSGSSRWMGWGWRSPTRPTYRSGRGWPAERSAQQNTPEIFSKNGLPQVLTECRTAQLS